MVRDESMIFSMIIYFCHAITKKFRYKANKYQLYRSFQAGFYVLLLTLFTMGYFKNTEVCSLLEWCFIILIGVSSDHSQLRCTDFAGSHSRESDQLDLPLH